MDHLYSSREIELGQEVEIDHSQKKNTDNITSAVEIIESQITDDCHSTSSKMSKHHEGPINIGYIMDKRARQKSFSKRIKTFKSQAEALHNMCGAKVTYTVEAEMGKRSVFSLPPIHVRHVKMQAGESLQGRAATRAVATPPPPPKTHSPKKSTSRINNMPGKTTLPAVSSVRVNNKCSVCTIIYNGKLDKAFKKKHGKNGIWLGCDHDGCHYWAHAVCAGQKIGTLKSVPTLKFLCPAHK